MTERKQVYFASKCDGMVTANFFVNNDGRVEAFFADGTIGSSQVTYGIEQRGKVFFLFERETQNPKPYEPIPAKNRRLKAKTKEEAIRELINHVIKPYVKPGKYSFPVDAEELRKGLESELLS